MAVEEPLPAVLSSISSGVLTAGLSSISFNVRQAEPTAICLLPSQSGHVPLAHDVVDEVGDLVVDLVEVLFGLLLVELRVALPRLVEADGGGEGRGRPGVRRGVGGGEVVAVALGVDERGVC